VKCEYFAYGTRLRLGRRPECGSPGVVITAAVPGQFKVVQTVDFGLTGELLSASGAVPIAETAGRERVVPGAGAARADRPGGAGARSVEAAVLLRRRRGGFERRGPDRRRAVGERHHVLSGSGCWGGPTPQRVRRCQPRKPSSRGESVRATRVSVSNQSRRTGTRQIYVSICFRAADTEHWPLAPACPQPRSHGHRPASSAQTS